MVTSVLGKDVIGEVTAFKLRFKGEDMKNREGR